jgi:hypothetical protein
LGPLYINVLRASAQRLEQANKSDEAAEKWGAARERLSNYRQLVAECQSPRFTREAAHLTQELNRGNA